MPIYRVYKLRNDGHVSGPPKVIDCRDDDAALREAQDLHKEHSCEVWDLARFVGRLDPTRPYALERQQRKK